MFYYRNYKFPFVLNYDSDGFLILPIGENLYLGECSNYNMDEFGVVNIKKINIRKYYISVMDDYDQIASGIIKFKSNNFEKVYDVYVNDKLNGCIKDIYDDGFKISANQFAHIFCNKFKPPQIRPQ